MTTPTSTAALIAAALEELRRGTATIVYGTATDTNTVAVAGADTAVALPHLQPVHAGDYAAVLVSGADRLILGPVGGGTEYGSYTPTLTNVAIGTGGSAANTAYYAFTGGGPAAGAVGLMTVQGRLVFGTSGATYPDNFPGVSLPSGFNLYQTFANLTPIGQVAFHDNGTGVFIGTIHEHGLGANYVVFRQVSGSLNQTTTVTASSPFTWTAGDSIEYSVTATAVRT